MRNYNQFYINGQWVAPIEPKLLDVINPANEEVCAQISMGSEADVDVAAKAARLAFNSYGYSSREERIALLEKIIEVYKKYYDEVADAITEEMGAPTKLAKGGQAHTGLGHFQSALKALKTYEFNEDLGNSEIVLEPIGVCGFITPWNWPINQIACKVAPALAVGCTVILKPSEVAPLSAYIFTKILDEAGVPAGVFNMINGDGPAVGTAISTHPEIDMVSFTGSTRAGTLVAQNAAPTVKRVAQELGGKSANIVLEDADLEKCITESVLDMFSNTGQSCNAPSRMIVPANKLTEINEIAARAAATVVTGDPRAEGITMGPVVSEVQFNKIQGLIQAGIDEGSELLCGGTGLPEGIEKGYYIKPTIFTNCTNDMIISREEIFGPVFCIIPYNTLDEAIEIANDTPYGLAGYIQGKDEKTIRYVASRIRAGNININGNYGDYDTPFGGFKQSGNGREWGPHGFADYLEVKAISGLK
ncbi:aldehyde dehydrogenase family protein [Dasania marina]|uniref:aldehyde dehydrogenase family protein n=1 Tax=Dasania marina TaxID=471499 RepID=UPI00038187F2|nr:aldehyde dehydrogenase family protein [Dasania marina]